jgi:hypothetical protein
VTATRGKVPPGRAGAAASECGKRPLLGSWAVNVVRPGLEPGSGREIGRVGSHSRGSWSGPSLSRAGFWIVAVWAASRRLLLSTSPWSKRKLGSHDVPELIAAIEHFIDSAQPFTWTKTPDQVLSKAMKRQDTSDALH